MAMPGPPAPVMLAGPSSTPTLGGATSAPPSASAAPGKATQTPSPSTSSNAQSSASRRPPRKSTLTQQQKNQKRQRATQDQLTTLEMEFNKNPTPTATVRERIAEEINMTERSVQIWFQNRYVVARCMVCFVASDETNLRLSGAPRSSCWRRRVWRPARTLTLFPSLCALTLPCRRWSLARDWPPASWAARGCCLTVTATWSRALERVARVKFVSLSRFQPCFPLASGLCTDIFHK